MTPVSRAFPAIFVILAALFLLALWPAKSASANGAHPGLREVFTGTAGPYEVRVEAVPIVGDLHLVVYLFTSDGAPVEGASVQAVGAGPGEPPPSVGPVANDPQADLDPGLYSVTLPGTTQAGEWDITLNIGPGEAQVTFPVALREPSGFSLIVIAALIAFGLFLAWMLFSWRRQAVKRRKAAA